MNENSNHPIILTRRDLKDMVTDCVDEGVGRAFTRIGINHQNPLDMQKDFQHLRGMREMVGNIKRYSLKVVTTAVVGALVGYVALGYALSDSLSPSKAKVPQSEVGRAIVDFYTKEHKDSTEDPK